MEEVRLDPSHRLVVHLLVDGLGAVRLEVLLEKVLVVGITPRSEPDVCGKSVSFESLMRW